MTRRIVIKTEVNLLRRFRSQAERTSFELAGCGESRSFLCMKSAKSFAVVLVTAPDLETARKLARTVLAARVAACVNIVPRIESHYWWQGRIESGLELLLIIKTTRARLAALEKVVLANHPYDTPEFLALPLQGGAEKYLAWLADSVRPA
jgi:periplasmic divalent cation tolerance protein